MNVTLYGAANDTIDRIYPEELERLGDLLGRRGHTLVFGGGATGLMGAAARGAKKAGGRVIGVMPEFMRDIEPVFEGCDEFVDTVTMSERKEKMESLADAFIVAPGGVGTLDEFYATLTNKKLGLHAKPIVLFNVRGFWDGVLASFGTSVSKGFIDARVMDLFSVADTAEYAVKIIEDQKQASKN